MAGRSENLSEHHGSYGREDGDAECRDRILSLGHGHGGDHTSSEAGNSELSGDVVLAFHGMQSIDRTVGIAFNQVFTRSRVRYVGSGFVTSRNGGGPGTAAGGPCLKGLQLFPCRSGQGDQLGGSADQVGFIQLPTFCERQMHRFDHGLLQLSA